MRDKTLPGNRQEVSELVERGDTQSLQDIEHEQLKVERGLRVRSRREELDYTLNDLSEITGLSY